MFIDHLLIQCSLRIGVWRYNNVRVCFTRDGYAMSSVAITCSIDLNKGPKKFEVNYQIPNFMFILLTHPGVEKAKELAEKQAGDPHTPSIPSEEHPVRCNKNHYQCS